MNTKKLTFHVLAWSLMFVVTTQLAAQHVATSHAKSPDYRAICEQIVKEQIVAGYPQDLDICK